MPRYLLTSTSPSTDPRRGGPDGASGVDDGSPAAPLTDSARGPIPARRSLIVLFAILLVAWVGVAGVGGPYFGKISEVATNDRSSFLPESAESTRAQEVIDRFSDDDYVPAIVVLENTDGVSKEDTADLEDLTATLEDDGLLAADASPVIPSEDGDALQLILPVSSETTGDDVEKIRDIISSAFPTATAADATPDETGSVPTPTTVADVHVTGPAGFAADLTEAFAGIDGILLLVALIAVFVILVIVYRSPLLPVIVLFTSVAALSASIFVIWHLADAGILLINGQVQGILFILVVGATTDYSLLVVARFRDALQTEPDRVRAGLAALKGVAEPIAASGGTVIAGLLVLLFTDLASTRALGPVAAIGIAVAMLAALTFLPAALVIIGRAVFWPFRPQVAAASARPEKKGLWARIAEVIAARPRLIWVGLVILLALPLIAFPQFKASGVAQSEFVLGESQARDGQDVLSEHYPGGSGTPTQVVVDANELSNAAEAVSRLGGVGSMTVAAEDSPSGTIGIDEDGKLQYPQGDPSSGGAPDAAGGSATIEPTAVDGQVLLEVTLSDAADSLAAEMTVTDIREAVHDIDPDALVGGETAVDLDTNTTAEADRALAIPIILLVITVILILLLRSLFAPLLLVALTVLSFGTALGVSALVFNHIIGFPGADPSVPLYAFVFLVALGIDYNIFLMSRVREESLKVGTRAGVLKGLVATGGVITSAGVVLAATFAALAVIPIMFLVQLAFIVTFGVLLDAILVRSLVVPALVHDIGRGVWWPWRKRIPRD